LKREPHALPCILANFLKENPMPFHNIGFKYKSMKLFLKVFDLEAPFGLSSQPKADQKESIYINYLCANQI